MPSSSRPAPRQSPQLQDIQWAFSTDYFNGASQPKIIVFDDDPTGSQTLHSCLLLMQWDVETLCVGLRDPAPIMFILTNTRSQSATVAAAITREVCHNLQRALAQVGLQDFLLVSRSDSTLRGHYPLETDVIAAELGGFDAHFLVPAFFECDRFTRESVHYLKLNGVETPVHETEFARDATFSYRHSYLPDYVTEKTQGQIPAAAVERFVLSDIRSGVRDRLTALTNNQCCVVDGETQADLDQFAADVLAVVSAGKRFLFRSAASLLTSLAKLPPQPIAPSAMHGYVRDHRPGAVIVGSHVRKTTEQLQHLLTAPRLKGIEVDVAQFLNLDLTTVRAQMLETIVVQMQQAHAVGQTVVIYTSREEIEFADATARLKFGSIVSAFLTDVVQYLPATIGFLMSKGGITSNNILSQGLALRSAYLLGQLLPGVSIVRTAPDHPQFPELPVVLFPGNVGDVSGLTVAYQRLSGGAVT